LSIQQGAYDLTELKGKVAVITGAGNNGIGWGLCKHAAGQLGMHVVAIDLHESLVRSAQERLSRQFPDVRIHGITCDVTEPEQLANANQFIAEHFPNLEIGAVFANAGTLFHKTILKSTVDEWVTTLNVNVLGVVNTIKAFLPTMQDSPSSSIFCATASIGGLVRGDGGSASYQASKHAVVSLTESLSFEIARRSPQIRVHVLCPCIVESALSKNSETNQQVKTGTIASSDLRPSRTPENHFAMTTERHAQQVFDLIAAGKFYLLTDNIRPYVDHDYPFEGIKIVRERMQNMLQLSLDNSAAFTTKPGEAKTATLTGAMFKQARTLRSPE
jgi:NAD(P)-dependent dehydrogenase (short-subunit alcohol dehydrogenase family)